MVAISIYRGNLHRVPDVPRRWLMPNPQISFKDFKLLTLRRSKALSRLRASTTTSSSNPNPSSLSKPPIELPTANVKVIDNGEGPSRKDEVHIASELVRGSSKKPLDGPDSFVDSKTDLRGKASEPVNGGATENQIEPVRDKGDLLSDKEKRKREVEDKLKVLNAKKHNLVLVLKQILHAEEELKRQNSMQGTTMRPSVPFQADGTNETGSMSKHMTPRMSTEANLGDDVGATDDLSNHNVHSRHIPRTTGMSTSSESPLRRTPSVQQNMVSPHPSRASSGATASPSRFALSGHQGNPMNLPSVSVSGTNYIASSPSPAASGGTSVFRDARQPSPWN
ncbi:myb proto-oncogene protein [Senna tora]|uniref:Myb proto-oncogene protein n=1 Tax=Senna tora TaxID=362788 RepID=A0A834X548_9FABA|nr:myb proto-oncogene protein [Senna tora]